jgi:hypothetical protein
MSAADKKGAANAAPAEEPAGDAPSTTAILPKEVIVHPLVLLSVTGTTWAPGMALVGLAPRRPCTVIEFADHYYRLVKDTPRRVVGVLLGETSKGRVDVTNSFAVPCEEDPKDPRVFFLDHDYLQT